MTKIVLVETVSTFRHVYAVRVDDQDPADFALDDVALNMGEDTISEVSQNHIAEDIWSHRVITEKEYLELFDRENSYLSDWSNDMKMRFIFDSLKERTSKVHSEVNLNGDC